MVYLNQVSSRRTTNKIRNYFTTIFRRHNKKICDPLPPIHFSQRGELIFLFLGEVRPFCILGQNDPANKARNRLCSISRAEKKAEWPKFFATFQQYTCPSLSRNAPSNPLPSPGHSETELFIAVQIFHAVSVRPRGIGSAAPAKRKILDGSQVRIGSHHGSR